MNEPDTTVFPSARLHEFCVRVLRHFEVPADHARLAADVLIAADLRAIDSHGVARLKTYVELFEAGRMNPRPAPRVIRETPSTATVDGDNGLGFVVSDFAMKIALEKAAAHGSGWVSVCNTNHFGIAGWYATQALARDMIGVAMTNSTKLVAPLWGAERMLGTNPIAVAVPTGAEPAMVLDMATCAAAFGKVEIAKRVRAAIPTGWAIGKDGRDTNDPQGMIDGGALLPLGSDREHGGHKGYGLALVVDVLCAVLSGANWGPFCPPFTLRLDPPKRSVGKGIGHCFGALRVDGFIEVDEFKRQMDDLIRTMRGTQPAPGTSGPLIPGDPERAAEAVRASSGIPLVGAVVEDLQDVARRTRIQF